ncbi:MAG TPA: hypothetical protein V6C69_00915 [Trichormus sp.]|jgi:hypothetical protein
MKRRNQTASALIEAMVGFFILIPLALAAGDLTVLFQTAQVNEEFAEQLARLCSTLPDKTNAVKACQDVIKQYHHGANITDVRLKQLDFDLGLQEVRVSTAMDVKMPIPFPGFQSQTVEAAVKQPIVSIPAPQ